MNYHIINVNLLGDGLMAVPAIRAFKETLTLNDQVFLYTQREPHTFIYGWLSCLDGAFAIDVDNPPNDVPIPKVKGVWVDNTDGSKSIFLDIGKCFEYSVRNNEPYAQGYARQLGVYPIIDLHYEAGISPQHIDIAQEYYNNNFAGKGKPIILVSHVSRSCASRKGQPANKMLGEQVWREMVEVLSDKFFFVFMVESEEDIIPDMGDCAFLVKAPIYILAALMKLAYMLVTIENGMVILGQATDSNILAIGGAVPFPYFWTGTAGKYIFLDYTGRGPAAISSEKIISSVQSLSEAIDGESKVFRLSSRS